MAWNLSYDAHVQDYMMRAGQLETLIDVLAELHAGDNREPDKIIVIRSPDELEHRNWIVKRTLKALQLLRIRGLKRANWSSILCGYWLVHKRERKERCNAKYTIHCLD